MSEKKERPPITCPYCRVPAKLDSELNIQEAGISTLIAFDRKCGRTFAVQFDRAPGVFTYMTGKIDWNYKLRDLLVKA